MHFALWVQECNGGWLPHAHFQLILDTVGMGSDLPGVGAPEDMALHRFCPNPATLPNLPDTKVIMSRAKNRTSSSGNLISAGTSA